MGFNDYYNKPKHPASLFAKWKAGEGDLVFWNGEENEKLPLPHKFAILEQTRRIQGFGLSGNTAVRFYSNEAVDYNDILQVSRKEGDKAAEQILCGKYSEIKEQLPAGARLAVQLYIVDYKTKEVQCLTLQGAALGAFISFSQKNRIYESWITIEKGEQEKKGTVTFYPPKFSLGAKFSEDELKTLVSQDKEIIGYLKSVHSNGLTAVEDSALDQTPDHYAGEESQEVPETEPIYDGATPANDIDLSQIPF